MDGTAPVARLAFNLGGEGRFSRFAFARASFECLNISADYIAIASAVYLVGSEVRCANQINASTVANLFPKKSEVFWASKIRWANALAFFVVLDEVS